MEISDIYNTNEKRYTISNNEIFKNVLEDLKDVTGLSFLSLLPKELTDASWSTKFYYIKWIINSNFPQYIPVLFSLLQAHGYNMKSELFDAAKLLAKNGYPEYDMDLNAYVKLSPKIDAVEYDNGMIRLCSDELGDFNFSSVFTGYKNNKQIVDFIKRYEIEHQCHLASWMLIDYLDYANLVTSLIPSYFEGTYYHTYLDDQESGLILDSANYIVASNDEYQKLLEPQRIVATRKSEINARYQKAIASGLISDREEDENFFTNSLALALYEQHQHRGL